MQKLNLPVNSFYFEIKSFGNGPAAEIIHITINLHTFQI